MFVGSPKNDTSMMEAIKLLKPGNFRTLFLATIFGTVGEGVFGLISIITVATKTGSALSVSLLIVLTTLPTMLLAPFQGVIIDRFDKIRLAWWSNLLRAVNISIIFLIVWIGLFNLIIFYACLFFYYILWYFQMTTTESLLKDVLLEGEAMSGMAFIQSAWQIGVLCAAPLAGLMLDRFGLAPTLALAIMMDVLGALFFLGIKLMPAANTSETRGTPTVRKPLTGYVHEYLREIKDGWQYIIRDRMLLLMVFVAASAHPFYQIINTLLAPFIYTRLGEGGFAIGLIEGGAGIGSLLSAVVCLLLIKLSLSGRVLLISELLLMLSVIMFSLTTTLSAAVIIYVAIGLFSGNMKVLAKSFTLETVKKEFSGRVMATVSLLGLMFGVITSLIAGGIADWNIFYAYGFAALFVLAPSIATFFWLLYRYRNADQDVVAFSPVKERSLL